MHAELSNKKGAGEFFYREAKALLAVRHSAVVHCHDLLSDEEGRVYLIMEMIEGVPLSKKMNDGPLSPDDVAILGARVAHGLGAAHRKGVIHRDVSPDNIVLPNGRVQEAKLIDFGIAKILQEGEGTIIDGFKGKLSYASPEQLAFFGGKIDGRSDFYSLGLVRVAAALGRPMGMGTTVMEAAPRLVDDPVVVAKVDTPSQKEPTTSKIPKTLPVRRLTASDRIKIIGLLNSAKLALGEDKLMSPPNDNAYDRYRRILALDPSSQKAKNGLREVAARYLGLTDTAVAKGDLAGARTFLERARKSDPDHPGISPTEARLAR